MKDKLLPAIFLFVYLFLSALLVSNAIIRHGQSMESVRIELPEWIGLEVAADDRTREALQEVTVGLDPSLQGSLFRLSANDQWIQESGREA